MRAPLLYTAALLAALLVLDSGRSEATEHPLPPAELTLIHANDVYEIQPVEGGRYGGPARMATVVADLKRAGGPVLATLGGDYLSPSALGTAKFNGQPLAGRQMVEVLGALGLDWTTLGNHEFDVSEARFRAHLSEAKFGIVSSNVVDGNGQPFAGLQTSAVVPVQAGGRTLRIGLVGLTIDSNRKPWVRYQDPIQSARDEVAKLQGKTDAIVALTHLSLAQDSRLAAAVPEIDLILGGHEHENWQIFRGPKFVPIVKADANFRSLAIVTLRFAAPGTRPTVTTRLQLVDDSIPADPTVAALAGRWTEVGFAAFRQDGFTPERVIALTDEPLDGLEATVRNRPGRLTGLIARAMQREAKRGRSPVQRRLGAHRRRVAGRTNHRVRHPAHPALWRPGGGSHPGRRPAHPGSGRRGAQPGVGGLPAFGRYHLGERHLAGGRQTSRSGRPLPGGADRFPPLRRRGEPRLPHPRQPAGARGRGIA